MNPPFLSSMSYPHAPPQPLRRSLRKQHSWSPDACREEAWLKRKKGIRHPPNRSKSFTDEDLEELKGCIELGFGFAPDSPDRDPKLSATLPALGFYCAVNRLYSCRLSRTPSISSIVSEGDAGSSTTIFDQDDEPETVKTRLKQWAQVVACSVKQFSGDSN